VVAQNCDSPNYLLLNEYFRWYYIEGNPVNFHWISEILTDSKLMDEGSSNMCGATLGEGVNIPILEWYEDEVGERRRFEPFLVSLHQFEPLKNINSK